jgi:peptide/nickel transport system substrate-binding protein
MPRRHFALGGLALALLLPGCRDRRPAPPRENVLVVGLESAPVHLDPRVGTDQASEYVSHLMLDGVVDRLPDGSLVPGIAASWEILEDGLRWRFRLRPEARFHDGTPLTSRDVAYTFNTILDGTIATSKKGAFGPLLRAEPRDAHTIDFVLKEPWGALLDNLVAAQGIIPAGTLPDRMQSAPIGSGPYRFVSRAPGRVELAAWDGYPWGRPPIDRVVLREVPDATVRALELEKGSVQLVINAFPPDTVSWFETRAGFDVVQRPGANYVYMGINLEDPVLADPRVRRAIAMAIDRERLVRTVWRGQGIPTETLLPPGHWARHEGLATIPHDPAGAARLLEEAGHRDPDGSGPRPRLALTYKCSNNDLSLLQAQAIQGMLAEAGIEVTLRAYEFATFYADVKRGAFQLMSLTWTGIADPDFFRNAFHSAAVPPAGANRVRYRNPEMDRLIDTGGRTFGEAARRPLYLRVQEILLRDLPYVSLLTKNTVAVMVEGLEGYESYRSAEIYAIRWMRWRRPGDAPPPPQPPRRAATPNGHRDAPGAASGSTTAPPTGPAVSGAPANAAETAQPARQPAAMALPAVDSAAAAASPT